MKKRIQVLTLGAMAIAIFCATASADIVVSHPPLNTGGPAADTEFINDSHQQSWQRLADDFQVTEDAVVRRITWQGFYGSSFLEEIEPPPVTETIRMRFYGARPEDGLPDDANILFEDCFLNPSRTATGRYVSVGPLPPEFRYEVDLVAPFALQAGTPYWLEVAQVSDINSLFRWEYSPGTQTPFAFVNLFVSDWRRTTLTANLAFELSTVPEPSTLLLFSLGFVFGGRKSR